MVPRGPDPATDEGIAVEQAVYYVEDLPLLDILAHHYYHLQQCPTNSLILFTERPSGRHSPFLLNTPLIFILYLPSLS